MNCLARREVRATRPRFLTSLIVNSDFIVVGTSGSGLTLPGQALCPVSFWFVRLSTCTVPTWLEVRGKTSVRFDYEEGVAKSQCDEITFHLSQFIYKSDAIAKPQTTTHTLSLSSYVDHVVLKEISAFLFSVFCFCTDRPHVFMQAELAPTWHVVLEKTVACFI